jgi:hypothetical protein
MNQFPLSIHAGRLAAQRLSDQGWSADLFTALIGASGGAKMLGLVHLDQFLFNDYLLRSDHPIELYGSSIGSWRHAAFAASNINVLQQRYQDQSWKEDDARSPGEIVDSLCEWVLDGVLTEEATDLIVDHPRFTTHIVTARGLGLNGQPRGARLAMGMGLSALGNLLDRRLLAGGFQRVVFSSGKSSAFRFDDFGSLHVPLNRHNLRPALLASGSIPFLMSGQTGIPDAPSGHYWDGGIIDYHFDLANIQSDGLLLYPHFSSQIVKGWFDKSIPWRRHQKAHMDRLVVLAPSRQYLKELPYGKIPDRKDFSRLSQSVRQAYWSEAVAASLQLAEAFQQVVQESDPLKYVAVLD